MSVRVQGVRLPRLLSLLPRDGVGARVYQTRWRGKGLAVPTAPLDAPTTGDGPCYYDVKRVRVNPKDQGKVDAFGVFYWKGKRVTPLDQEFEPIRGGSKYLWQSADPPVALRTTKTAPATSPAAPEEQA